MANEQVVLTSEGFAKLEQELMELKGPGRKELAERLKLAISYGDLKENSEYHSAKDDQAFMETRIMTIEKMLTNAQIVDAGKLRAGVVGIGSTVTLLDVEFEEKIEYLLVGPAEADVSANKISYESPLGMALMGKKIGDSITVQAPVGDIRYDLLDITIK